MDMEDHSVFRAIKISWRTTDRRKMQLHREPDMEFGYFSEVQAEQFPFFRMPKVMFGDRLFKGISRDGKVLYGLLLDRVSLSRENGWIDDEGHVYVIFTLESIQMRMDCSDK